MKITKKKFIFKLSAVIFSVLVILFLWWNFGADSDDSFFHKNWSTSDKSISFTSTNMKGIYGSAQSIYPGKVKYNNKTMDIQVALDGGYSFDVYYKSNLIAFGRASYNPFLGRIRVRITDLGTDQYYYHLFDGVFKINQELVFYKEGIF